MPCKTRTQPTNKDKDKKEGIHPSSWWVCRSLHPELMCKFPRQSYPTTTWSDSISVLTDTPTCMRSTLRATLHMYYHRYNAGFKPFYSFFLFNEFNYLVYQDSLQSDPTFGPALQARGCQRPMESSTPCTPASPQTFWASG